MAFLKIDDVAKTLGVGIPRLRQILAQAHEKGIKVETRMDGKFVLYSDKSIQQLAVEYRAGAFSKSGIIRSRKRMKPLHELLMGQMSKEQTELFKARFSGPNILEQLKGSQLKRDLDKMQAELEALDREYELKRAAIIAKYKGY